MLLQYLDLYAKQSDDEEDKAAKMIKIRAAGGVVSKMRLEIDEALE
jgi:hypothetical protein